MRPESSRYLSAKELHMRTISTLVTLLPFALFAQTTWNVEAGGTLSDPNNLPYYAPMELIINVGDIVLWTNVEGTHNVSGELTLFPNNPEGFSNGQPAGAPWTFSYTFTLPGSMSTIARKPSKGNRTAPPSTV